MFKIKINPLWIVLLFALSYYGKMQMIVLYFIYLLLHEMGHMYVAKVLGYKFDTIDFMPYGLGLKTNTTYIRVKDDILISIGGPLINAMIIVIIIILWWFHPISYYYTLDSFYINISILFINLLPIFPLDGGRVLIVILKERYKEKAIKIIKVVTIIFIVIFAVLFFVSVFIEINVSFFIMAVFLFLSIDNSNFDVMLYYINSVYKKEDAVMEVKTFYINLANTSKSDIIKKLSSKYIAKFVINVNGKVVVQYEKDILNYFDNAVV